VGLGSLSATRVAPGDLPDNSSAGTLSAADAHSRIPESELVVLIRGLIWLIR